MPCVFNLADVLEFVVDGLDECPFPEQDFVVQVHEGVLHVLLEFGDKVYVVNEKGLEQLPAYVPPVGEELPEQPVCEVLVLQGFTVVHVPGRECPLYDFPAVVNDDVQLEAVEPSHGAFAPGRPSPHGLVAVGTLYVA